MLRGGCVCECCVCKAHLQSRTEEDVSSAAQCNDLILLVGQEEDKGRERMTFERSLTRLTTGTLA